MWAALLSFSVYLLPLVGPHSLTLLGAGLLQELTGGRDRSALWLATDLGVAVVLQCVAYALCYWFLRRPRVLSGVLVLAAVPMFIVAAEVSYLVAIPSLFLIERDKAEETGAWPVLCTANGSLAAVRSPQSRGQTDISEVLLQIPDGSYQLMGTSDCRVTTLPLPRPTVQPGGRVDFMVGVSYVVAGRGILVQSTETANATVSWSVLKSGPGELTPIHLSGPMPILSTDGDWIGWTALDEGTGPPPTRMFIRRLAGDAPEVEIDLSRFGQTSMHSLVHLDVQRREVVMATNDASRYVFQRVSFDGTLLSSIEPDGVAPHDQTFWMTPGGWVAWDGYQEREPYRVRWSLPGGSRHHLIPLGRGVTSVAVNAAGTLIAVSVTSALNIGNIPDAVFVLRATDGAEVFRRYLPRYSRSEVVFPRDDVFAYSSEGKTFLLRVVRPLSTASPG